jgi:N-acetylglucosaminyldiphosphoundecaprenol N-acetyl-beta-D-mannosaminyltransferase
MDAKHKNILSMPVAVTSYDDAAHLILRAANGNEAKYVCVANVHMCMEAFDSSYFKQVVNNANLVVPDGMPLVWGLKTIGEKKASQVRGSDLMLRLCAEAQKQNIPIGLYGGTPDSLTDLLKFFKKEFPSLRISFSSSPPFRTLTQQEKDNYVEEINASGAKILFVGLGCPKQEKWMAEHRDKLSCVMIGVGAAFDFFSGKKKHAPRLMQKAGLEWLFRFSNEPSRLWKRYLKHNPRFVWYLLKQLINKND